MKIGITANTGWYLWNFQRRLIEEIKSEGHEIICFTPLDKYVSQLEYLGIEHVPIQLSQTSTNPLTEAASYHSIKKQLKRYHPNQLLSFTAKMNLYAGLAARSLGIPLIANVSGLGDLFSSQRLLLKIIRRPLLSMALGRAGHVFFQNQEDMDSFVVDGNLLDSSCCSRLPGSGVDLERFGKKLQAQWPKPNRERVFLMFGRYLPNKGFEKFVSAAKISKASGASAKFRVMGRVEKGRSESLALFSILESEQKEGSIEIFQWSESVEAVIGEADVIVLPTCYNEGVPRTLLEGLASGKAIITTDWKGARDTVDHQDNGLLVPPNDVDALAMALVTLSKLSDKDLMQMQRKSREKAEREFDQDIVLYKYLNAISQISIAADN